MTAAPGPTFLKLPERFAKPRRGGLTHVLDKGCTWSSAQAVLSSTADFIDVWKFGWGTAYLDPAARAKVAALRSSQIKACTGGTLLEVAWLQGKSEDFFAFAGELGFDCVEVSDGATDMPLREKRKLIVRARELGFVVMAEVGSKDPTKIATPSQWREEIEGDVAAGATWVVAEGRESGTVGLYDKNGGIRDSLLRVLNSGAYASSVIYEAPQRAQQSYLIRELGPHVNLGNIAIEDVMGVEALRLGLRADTLGHVPGGAELDAERAAGVQF